MGEAQLGGVSAIIRMKLIFILKTGDNRRKDPIDIVVLSKFGTGARIVGIDIA